MFLSCAALMCEAYESEPGECTWHYNECGSVCPETCQHRHSIDSFTCHLSMPCVEGCFPVCPNGKACSVIFVCTQLIAIITLRHPL